MSAARQRGTAAETAVVNVYRKAGWPLAERRALAGRFDKGDIAGVTWATEVKSARTLRLQEWLRELEVEKHNAGAEHGLLVVKAVGIGPANADQWYGIQRLGDALALFRKAGL